MRARMHNTIHVEVEIVKLLPIRVGSGSIDGNSRAIRHCNRLVLNHRGNDLGVPARKPSEGSGDTHDGLL